MSSTLPDLAIAQDALNASLKTTIDTFINDNPEVNINYCNIQVNRNIDNMLETSVHTSVDSIIDGARITRAIPQG